MRWHTRRGEQSAGSRVSARLTRVRSSRCSIRSSRILPPISASRLRRSSQDVGTRCLAVVAQRDDAADLPERQAQRLRRPDEGQPVQHGVVVVAVARCRPSSRLHQTDVLVVAERLGRHPRAPRDLTDQHDLAFLCTGSLDGSGRSTAAALDLPVQGKVQDERVDVTVLYVEACPHVGLARARIADCARAARRTGGGHRAVDPHPHRRSRRRVSRLADDPHQRRRPLPRRRHRARCPAGSIQPRRDSTVRRPSPSSSRCSRPTTEAA